MSAGTMDLLNPQPEPEPAAPKDGRGSRAAGKRTTSRAHRAEKPAPAASRRPVAEPATPRMSVLPPEREPAPIVLATEPAPRRGEEWSPGFVATIRRMYGKDLTDDQFDVFVHIARRTGLDPAARQIYAVVRNNKVKKNGQEIWEKVMTIQTGIDGFRLIADRTGRYAPGRAPVFAYDSAGKLVSATAHVKKLTRDGTWHEVEATAFFDEFVQKDSGGNVTRFWSQMKHNQTAKCAEALALRKAFPARLSNVYTDDEMMQADNEFLGGRPSPAVAAADAHAALQAERRAQDAAAEGVVIDLNGEGSAAAAPGTSGESAARSTPKSSEPPAPRGSASASPATTRTDGKTAAGGMVTTIRANAKRAGLLDETTGIVTFPENVAGQLGLDQLSHSPQALAAQVNASEIARTLFELGKARTAAPAR